MPAVKNQSMNRTASAESLEHAIMMAIADGILTSNERNLIKVLVKKKDWITKR